VTGDDALVLEGIHHRFGAAIALRDASLRVRRGTIHALIGENGAGKTTLMRIAFGLLAPERGTIAIDGSVLRLRSSADAIAAGLGMVHQHFMLVPALTVTENVALGGHGRFDIAANAARLRSLAERVGLAIDPDATVDALSVSEQQRVEILKALAHDARILILDEPTAVLSPQEGAQLLRWVRRFVADGGTAVLITHKLREALEFSDDVTVLRRGETTYHAPVASTEERTLVTALTGSADSLLLVPVATHSDDDGAAVTRLVLDGVSHVDGRGVTRLRDVSLSVRAGEILGVLGVEGSGHRELLRILAGRVSPTSGTSRLPARVGFVPEDRQRDALIPEFPLDENLAMADAGRAGGLLDWPAIRSRTWQLLETADVRAGGPRAAARTLSGGNQQKFVVAREQAVAREALVAEHPTRGLDLVASARVLAELRRAAIERDVAVVVHSPDLEEVLAIATRVVVCFAGRVREVPRPADPNDRTPFARALVGAD
jgi:ABC-type uncharacterized transport system ATPase subunit